MTVRKHLAVTLVATCVTAWFSYACFHNDEYFQVIELARWKLAPADVSLLPWEVGSRLRPWLQPFFYWALARMVGVLGVHDIFQLAFVFRLVTGLASVFALGWFLRTTMPWQKTPGEKLLHLRTATLLGFLPYLFVRTSSETGSMVLSTIAWACLLEGATPGDRLWVVPSLARGRWRRMVLAGFLFGLAFEMRFQTALIAAGVVLWLLVVGRAPGEVNRSGRWLAPLTSGGVLALVVGAFLDRWGYGVWTFPPWTYFRVNALEGVAAVFGTSPPFAYLWLLPANVFMPVVLALLVLALVAWFRCPRHPLTWATLPFFLVHNLVAHKEERFLFPIAILATGFVTMALGPSGGAGRFVDRLAARGWSIGRRWPGKLLATFSFAGMLLLAFVPLGWNHNVRFTRFLHDRFGREVHATMLTDADQHLPAFHPAVYDVDRATPEEVARRIEAGTAREWLIADHPVLRTNSPLLDARAKLVFSELYGYRDPLFVERALGVVDAYNGSLGAVLRPLRFRSLYRIEIAPSPSSASSYR